MTYWECPKCDCNLVFNPLNTYIKGTKRGKVEVETTCPRCDYKMEHTISLQDVIEWLMHIEWRLASFKI